jgi:hypothetical protein
MNNQILLYLKHQVMIAANPAPINQGSLIFFGVVITIVGLVSIAFPHIFWHLRVGRKIPGVPPNKLYLTVLRFGGILVVVLGLVMLLYPGLSVN